MPENTPPRLTYLRIRNYRALRDVVFRDLTPLTVLIGANGSGKSTVLDALAFLGEAAGGSMIQAWKKRNQFEGIRTRGETGAIQFEMGLMRESVDVVYQLEIDEVDGNVFLKNEELHSVQDGIKKTVFKAQEEERRAVIKLNTYPQLLDEQVEREQLWLQASGITAVGFAFALDRKLIKYTALVLSQASFYHKLFGSAAGVSVGPFA